VNLLFKEGFPKKIGQKILLLQLWKLFKYLFQAYFKSQRATEQYVKFKKNVGNRQCIENFIK
jgi:hypothetical protein